MTIFVGIAGAKGGVGKTTVSINLTAALRDFYREVVLVDCHLKKPNVGLYLGYTHTPKTIHSAMLGKHKLSETVYNHPSGITIIPGDLAIESADQSITYEQLHDGLLELMNKAEIVIIDTPSGIDSEAKLVLRACDAAILVTTPDLISLTDTLKTERLLRSLGKKIIGVVVTQVREKSYETSLENIEATLGCPVIGNIPYDEALHHAQSFRHPVIYANQSSKATIAFKKLAANLIGEKFVYSHSEQETFLEYLLERMHILKHKF